MDRREFLKLAGLFSLSLVAQTLPGWMGHSLALGAGVAPKRLVVVFLRGAVDGLNVVIPASDPRYYDLRPNIAIPEPGQSGGALTLDSRFGLHPALSALHPYWKSGRLAFVHSSGSPNGTRSHFDAQDYMESGTPGRKSTTDGWLNRLIQALPQSGSPTQAINFGPTLPRILKGSATVANISTGRKGQQRRSPIDRPYVSGLFEDLYDGNDALGRAFHDATEARASIRESLKTEMMRANNGAPLPGQFGQMATQLAALLRNDPTMKTAFLALGGWDTHVNQGATSGALARNLKQVGDGLALLANRLGPTLDDTVIVVMSEFGRTAKENGNNGTDHGHGNVMWLLGGPVGGGRVYGDWPGLSSSALYEGRDLAVTTDFRNVLYPVLTHHMGLSGPQADHVFPGFAPRPVPLIRT